MVQQYIKFIENDVDGYGTDVDLYIKIDTVLPVTASYVTKLQEALANIKSEQPTNACDIYSMIREAVQRVFGPEQEFEFVNCDLIVEF